MDGAWADNNDEAIVSVIDDGLHSLPRCDDRLPRCQREWELLAQAGRRQEWAHVADASILSALLKIIHRI